MTEKEIKEKINKLTPIIDKYVKMYYNNSIKSDDSYILEEWYVTKDENNLLFSFFICIFALKIFK